MSQPFDASGKTLLDLGPAEWLALFGSPRPAALLSVISADLSTVTAMADHVVRVDDPIPWLLHVEFQAYWDDTLPARLLAYNGALRAKHGLDAASVAVLLTPAANASALTGSLRVSPPLGKKWTFPYTVVRLWQLPADSFLTGPPLLLPLTLLSDVKRADARRTAGQVHDRLKALNDPGLADKLLSIFCSLLHLRYDKMAVQDITDYLGIRGLEQNPGVKAWIDKGEERGLEKGRRDEARATVLRLGTIRFGKPTKKTVAALNAITDLTALEDLTVRLLTAADWKDLLTTPVSK